FILRCTYKLDHASGALLWEYWFWNNNPIGFVVIMVFGYLHFMLISFWVYDMNDTSKQAKVVGLIYLFDILAISISLALGLI
ncbi:MAG: hypothetical protein OEY49_17660, partial [Candidatus Heimdallarchaeota archaeon]|nr:hypothetical protein [Candidatus Heimdallarchaeota archaeon]